MKVAYFDCFAGASGDMILGALVDAGLPLDALKRELSCLPLQDWMISAERVATGGLAATRVSVTTKEVPQARAYTDLDSLIISSPLKDTTRKTASRILRRLAEVESRLHGVSLENVHLHELGGDDTLIDIVGAVAGLDLLGIEEIFVSPLPLGSGSVTSRHGILPLPAPAVVELVRGAPVRYVDIQAELVTPTGAAILTTLATGYSTFPPMTLLAAGSGAGMRALPIPNILRVMIGETTGTTADNIESLIMVETNIDDMNPQVYEHVMAKLFEAGALDVWLTPILMKKERTGTLLSALYRPGAEHEITRIIFTETTTLGVRRHEVRREGLARETVTVETKYGPVRVKVARMKGQIVGARPEYEDCRIHAERLGMPLLEVFGAAEAAIRSSAVLQSDTLPS